jgi:Type II secretion system (T2SS), protein M subtype b
MTLTDRDRRALVILGASLIVGGFIYWYTGSSSVPATAIPGPPVDSIDQAQRRIAALRQKAAAFPGKETVLKEASAELGERERGLLTGETADEAQSQLLQVVKRVANQQTPPLDVRQVELNRPRAYGSDYGRVSLSLSLTCHIDELVNFLAALGAQPELVATEDIRFGASHLKQKTIPIRLTVSGLVARRLIPKQRGVPQL